jgi:hypothetical protein
VRTLAAILCAGLAWPALAEMQDETRTIGDQLVTIKVFDTLEIMTVGPGAQSQVQVLSGADIEILAATEDPDSLALVGAPVLVAEVTGTHSCEAGDPRAYYVVTLGDGPTLEGPVTTCTQLTVSMTSGMIVLESDPMGDDGEFWTWGPGKGWSSRLD